MIKLLVIAGNKNKLHQLLGRCKKNYQDILINIVIYIKVYLL